MKLRQISFKIISMVMVFAMMFSISATTISAVWTHDDHIHEKDEIYYVSLGDSMSNGYCFDGYTQGDLADGAFISGNGGYGNAAYPNLFAAWLENTYNVTVTHKPLAPSAMRAEDLLYLLGGREMPTDEWTKQVSVYTGEWNLDELSKYFTENVTNADIITMGIGNASFGAYLLHRVTDALGVLGGELEEGEKVTLEQALVGLDEEQKALVLEIYNEVYAELLTYVPENIEEYGVKNLEDVANLLAYTAAGFILNYAGVVDRIVELNPDVELILVGLMNTTYGMNVTVEGMDPIPVGDIMDKVFGALNAYVAAYPTVKQANGDFEQATFYYAEIEELEFISQKFDDLKDAGWGVLEGLDGQVVRDRNIDAYNGELRKIISAGMSDILSGFGISVLPEINAGDFTNPRSMAHHVSAQIYLGIEDAVAASCETMDIPLTGLINIITDISSIFNGFEPDASDIRGSLASYLTSTDVMKGICKIYALFKVGNGMSVHPTPVAHAELAEVIKNAYANGHTAQDETVENLLETAGALTDLVAKYYDDAYAYAYGELAAAGYVEDAKAGVAEAINAVKAVIAEVEGLNVPADLEASKALLLEELNLTVETLEKVIELLDVADELDAETFAELEALADLLLQNLEKVGALAAELGTVAADHANAQLQVVVNDLKALVEDVLTATAEELENLVKELSALVYAYLTETLPAEYNAFVNAVVSAVKTYSAEAADYVYNWLLNNPVKVIEFFAEYGDDAVDFLVDNAKVIFGVIGFVATSYGEDLLNLVLDNADVILTAAVEWFSIHGENAWDLIVVYFNAIVSYYDLALDLDIDFDFSSLEDIHNTFNEIFGLLGDLVDMIKDGIYDVAEALNVLEKLESAIAKLNADLKAGLMGIIEGVNSLVEGKLGALNEYFEDQINALKALVAEQIEALKAEAQAQIDALKAQAQAQIEALKAEIEAKIAELKAQLETAVGEAKAKLEAEIARLEALLEAKIAEINAAVEAKIAEINAQLKAQIDALNAQLEAQVNALKAELEALVEMEINNLEDAVAALDKALQIGVKNLGEYVYDMIVSFVEDAVSAEFTPTEDSYYVSVNGGDAYYAELLAEKLSEKLDSSIKFDTTVWGELDYDMLSKADLITIGYDANELTDFAVSQMLAYVANFVDTDIRNNTNAYVAEVFTLLNAAFHEIVDGKFNVDFDFDDYKQPAYDAINSTIDELLAYELIAGNELTEMDWAKYVGEDNLSYVDEARAALKAELTEAGVIETFSYTIDVVAYLYENAEELGLADALNFINMNYAYEVLGDAAYYTVEVPVADSIVFAAESYLYGNVAFQAEYGKLIFDLYEINPEAVVILLGHYNAYDFELSLGDVTIDLTDAYGCVAGVSSLQAFTYALLSEKVAYVDIYDAETVYDSYVAEGLVDNSLLNFVMMYLADSSITDASEAGNVYIYEQIMSILTVGCAHKYDNACDADCNKCGELRETNHVYDNACDNSCNVCGEIREVADHEYDENGVCVNCGHKLPVIPDHTHTFDGCDDTTCNGCDFVREASEHAFDNDCDDVTCYKCSYVRPYTPHTYTNCTDKTCDVCGEDRVATPGHAYNNACDVDCNVCGETRQVADHVYSGCLDSDCDVCGYETEAEGHKYGDWTVTVKATRKTAGQEIHTCTACGKIETKTIAALGGLGGGAIAGIVIGSVVVAGAAGFAIYWFLIQKKTFAALVEGVKALVGGLTGSAAAPAAAEAGAAEAAAEAPAAEATETEAPASEEETK